MKLLTQLPDAYIVGGAVRDKIMGKIPKDIDVVTSMPPNRVLQFFDSYPLGEKFGTVVVRTDEGEVEVTTMRKELTGGRHPVVEFTDNLDVDLRRRDFKMNAMAMDKFGNIHDPFGGQKDISNKIVSSVGFPEITLDRTYGDPLRALRAIRFSVLLGFTVDMELENAIINADLSELSGERVYAELAQMFKEPAKAMEKMYFYNIINKILPAVDNLQYCIQDPKWHPEGDALVHTVEVMERVKEYGTLAIIAAMLHDIGKSIVREGTSYHGHAHAGVELAENIMKMFGRPKFEVEAVKFVVENHMKIKKIDEMRPMKRRKLYDSPHFDLLVTIAKADNADRGNESIFEFIENDEPIARIDLKPVLNGYELMDLKLHGPVIGKIQRIMQEFQLLGIVETKGDAYRLMTTMYTIAVNE